MKKRPACLLRDAVPIVPEGLSDEILCIRLTRGYVALIDPEDGYLASWNWCALVGQHSAYAVRVEGKMVCMHRQIAQPSDGQDVDHRDQHRYFADLIIDNRRGNLRCVSDSQNMANARKWRRPTSSRYKGVSWNKKNEKWLAKIQAAGRQIYLGLFGSEQEAAQAYNDAHQHHFPGIAEGLNPVI